MATTKTAEKPANGGQKTEQQQAQAQDAPEDVRGWNIYQRMHAAMREVGRIDKDGRAPAQAGGYDYVTHAQITAAARRVFGKYRIVMTSTLVEHQSEIIKNAKGNNTLWTTVKMRLRFTNVDRPEDYIESEYIGYGLDGQDKSIAKAITYAMKYGMLNGSGLQLSTEDDPEADHQQEFEHQQNPTRGSGSQQNGNGAKSRQQDAREALGKAERSAGLLRPEDMNNAELYRHGVEVLEKMGGSKEHFNAHLKATWPGLSTVGEIPREELLAVVADLRIKSGLVEQMQSLAKRLDLEAERDVSAFLSEVDLLTTDAESFRDVCTSLANQRKGD